MAREIGDQLGEGIAHFNLSIDLFSLGEHQRAIAHAEAALKIFERFGDSKAEILREQLSLWQTEDSSGEIAEPPTA